MRVALARLQPFARKAHHHLRQLGDLGHISRRRLFGEAPLAFERVLRAAAARERRPGRHVFLQTHLRELRDFLRQRIHPIEPAGEGQLVGLEQEAIVRRPAAGRRRPLCRLRVLGLVRHDCSSDSWVGRLISRVGGGGSIRPPLVVVSSLERACDAVSRRTRSGRHPRLPWPDARYGRAVHRRVPAPDRPSRIRRSERPQYDRFRRRNSIDSWTWPLLLARRALTGGAVFPGSIRDCPRMCRSYRAQVQSIRHAPRVLFIQAVSNTGRRRIKEGPALWSERRKT